MSNETWKPVAGYEGQYIVSDCGRVARIQRPRPNNKGYHIAGLSGGGKTKYRLNHRLVLEAFVGPCPDGMEARHYPDSNPANNNLSNLQWGTRLANCMDKVEHGTTNRGERHPLAKLTETDVERIFDLRKHECTYIQIARWFNISFSHVGQILSGKYWAHREAA